MERLNFELYKNRFYDEFGNRTNNYIIDRFIKYDNGKWVKEKTYYTNTGNNYVLDGKIYFKCNDSLIPMNMDFDSESCGACEAIVGEDTTEYKKITGNVVLHKTDEPLNMTLMRQNFSDGTCYYTFQDRFGNWNLRHGSQNVEKLIDTINIDIKLNKRHQTKDYAQKNIECLENLRKSEKCYKGVLRVLKMEMNRCS